MGKWANQQRNILKSEGIKISRKAILDGDRRFLKENESILTEANRERSVLRMKSFYKKRGWNFPPKTHKIKTVCDLINTYYEKDLVKHIPQDEMEKKIWKR